MRSRYGLTILLQVILIAFVPCLFWLSMDNPTLVFTRVALVIAWLVQIAFLLYSLKASDRDLDRFVKIIANEDDYQLLSHGGWLRPHSEALVEINSVISSFKKLKAQKESDLLFFKLVMEHTPVGVMAVSENNKIVLINRSAREMLEVDELNDLTHLDRKKDGLSEWFNELVPGNASLLSTDSPARSLYLSVVVTSMKIQGENIRLYSIKDIKNEVDRREMETLQRMMRLLSHEVVNSISPISLLAASLGKSIADLAAQKELNPSDPSRLEDLELGLATIHKRSNDLNEFVGSIRALTTIPEPRLECIKVESLFQQSAGLMKPQLAASNITLITRSGELTLLCDPRLVIQVLINLVKNCMEALVNSVNGEITISCEKRNEVTYIRVEDNGPGVPDSIREEIFSPFFTTKKTGSGIGLSFTKQVMSVHNGNINLWCGDGRTIFSLSFPGVNSV